MPSIAPRLLREVIDHLTNTPEAELSGRDLAEKLRRYLKRKTSPASRGYKGASRKEMKAQRRASFAEEWEVIKIAIAMRSGGRCECCDIGSHQTVMTPDHFVGGSGRRRQRQSVETAWILCLRCHRLKTDNDPSRKWWAARFITHCEHHGYKVPREVLAWAEAA